ncbi:YqiA/YcfP family alpha/beta fold hydrolase [Alteromonas gilva]|uniref:Esterase YqiA n=1 Tax=Alteromonas gilva TaxID=2987522 RepID=A0ABT5L7N9_9ALTE|nr:YqiA/YcfP family alpha/beta fold hydrolase [Alteromonas gilva]MDC8833065.1 esterase YqiA [Alteromonas gilva]
MNCILYLHGFLSSPHSIKAQQTRAYLQNQHPDVEFICPELSNSPARLAAQLNDLLTQQPKILTQGLRVIGSSMGGYLATWLVEQFGGRAVLINPAVKPFELLQDYLGEHENPYTNKRFILRSDDIDHIRDFYQPVLANPQRYHVLLQTGDETLDYRLAAAHYEGASVCIEQGGDHSFVGYEDHLGEIMRFLQGRQD